MLEWSQITVGVAAVLGLIYVARTLRNVVSDVLEFLGNHLSGVTESLRNLTVATERLAGDVDRLADEAADAHRQAAQRHTEEQR